ncbi:hypothetical protein K432DRAFT_387300 [Lepidopterella palustris CBS 459.81]|uniref:Uncharacterized protein n=1 Tax=Lepidopterella palustris CBS 459.81 TaxID=1314670 RepID=A0A8E2DXK3_9PEZI|nr:hypothetical protein K432DRAFT_387300 [Lepidopterella palustris CBS 459.81]
MPRAQNPTCWDRISMDPNKLQSIRTSLLLHQSNLSLFLAALPTRTIERIAGGQIRIDLLYPLLENLARAIFPQTSDKSNGDSNTGIPLEKAAKDLRSSLAQNDECSQYENEDFEAAQKQYIESQVFGTAITESLQGASESSTLAPPNELGEGTMSEDDDWETAALQFQEGIIHDIEEQQRMREGRQALEDANSRISELESRVASLQ